MTRFFILAVQLILISAPISAMQIEADPRIINSFMDKSLPPELDILRVTTNISDDNNLIFQVQTKGERVSGNKTDYVLLNIQHEKTYALIIPVNKGMEESIRIYEGDLDIDKQLIATNFKKSKINSDHAGFNVKHIDRGTEFTIPLDWINFGANFSFDAYTITADLQENTLTISKVHDQARRGRSQIKQISAITLLNNICSPKK